MSYINIINPFTGKLQKVTVDTANSPGGSDTQVQYNNGGLFGGAQIWYLLGKTGFGSSASTPRGTIDAHDVTTYTISDVTTSDSTIYPTYGSGNASAQNYDWTYYVYAYKTISANGVTIYSPNPLIFTFHDNASFDPMYFEFSWNAVAGADGYRVIVVNDSQYGAAGDYYTDIPAPYTSAIYYRDDTDGFETNSATYYTPGNVITPNSTTVGSDFYVDSITGNVYSNGVLLSPWVRTGTDLYWSGKIGLNGNTSPSATVDIGGGDQIYLANTGNAILERVSADLRVASSSFWTSQSFYTGGTKRLGINSTGNIEVITKVLIGESPNTAYHLSIRKSSGNAHIGLTSVDTTSYGGMFFGSEDFARYFQFASWSSASGGPGRFGITNNCNEILSVGGSASFVVGTHQSSQQMILGTASVARMTFGGSGTITLSTTLALGDNNVTMGTTTGTKWGSATNQKQGWWNATPIVQPTTAFAAATFVANSGTAVNDASTFDGYTLKQVVKAFRTMGLLA